MNAKDIVNKKFEKSTFSGYKMDDVDEFLRDVSVEFKQMENENAELEKKLEVLADKIREYRSEEEALKDAILVAKKQGIIILNEAKEQAAKLTAENKETIAKRTKDTDDLVAKKREFAEKTIADAEAEAERIITEAKSQADEIHTIMQQQTEREQIVLQRTRKEVADYTARILSTYKAHISTIKALPEEVENEFVVNTAKEVERRPASESAFYKKPEEKKTEKEEKPQDKANTVEIEKNSDEEPFKAVEPKTAEISEKKDNTETAPLFNLDSEKKNEKPKKELQFGGKK